MNLNRQIVQCTRCPRLRTHCAKVAQIKRKAYRNEVYWGLPVPGFGDPQAPFWIVGLAPGAHGANRTGRVFTGDSSGDWLYKALYDHGWSSQAQSVSSQDGLTLSGVYISCICRCAPPQNKPTTDEMANCFSYLQQEWKLLHHPPLILALGKVAFDSVVGLLTAHYQIKRNPKWKFKHSALYLIGKTQVLVSYHPSRQNTSTRKLTLTLWNSVFAQAKTFLKDHPF